MRTTTSRMAVRRRGGPARSHCSPRLTRLVLFVVIASLSLLATSRNISATISGAGSGLLAYYTFDQTSDTVAADSGGNFYTGTLVNGPVWSPGHVGSGALLFDNVNDRVSLPLDVPAAEGLALTVSAWVKPSTIADNGVIVAKDRSGFPQWKLRMDGRSGNNSTNNLMFSVGAGGRTVTAESTAEVMADLNWHHVVGVYDGAQVYVYMDGVSVDSTPNPLTGIINNYPHQVCIGTSGSTCNESAYFGGLIDDVRIYGRALTSAEVHELFVYSGVEVPPTPDTLPPSVAIASPAAGAELSGSAAFAATASDDIGVIGVQFMLDGAALQGEDTTAPYGVTLDTTTVANGAHTVRAVARDAAGNATSTADRAFTINNASTPAPMAVLAYYPFDQTSGTSATDSSGHNYTGTLVNGPVWTTGRVGSGALQFDNVNDRVTLPLDVPGAEGAAITVAAWVKPSTIADDGVIIAKDRSGFAQWKLRMDGRSGNNGKNNLSFSVSGSGKNVSATSDAEVMADLNWHHVVGVYDGAQVYVYMDGVSVDSTPNAMTGTINNYAHQVCIGTSGPTCNESGYFGGLIDDVRIYDRALAPAEVQGLMSAPSSSFPGVAVTASDSSASEAGDTGTFTFTRTGPTTASLAVTYSVDGTAVNGTDYASLSGVAVIPAGSATTSVTLTPIDDPYTEPGETAVVTVLASQSYAVASPASATIGILDNEVQDTSTIVIDHTSVALYDQIPAYYLAEAKKMFLNVPGESDSRAFKNGLVYLAQQNPTFTASVRDSGPPEGPRSDALRFSGAHWGDVDTATGWLAWYGEEDWFTSDMSKERTKAHIRYSSNAGTTISAIGFGWCVDMCRSSGGTSGVDPVYQVKWAGSTVGGPDGNLPWGLDDGDFSVTGNSVNLDTYLIANEEYQYFANTNGIATKVFLTTGPLRDNCGGEHPAEGVGYQTSLKHERIRQYALSHPGSILFDFADIMSYNDNGQVLTRSYTNLAGVVVTYNSMHPANMLNFDGSVNTEATDADGDHIGQAGSLRIGKAAWVLMARIAGWNGRPN